MIESDTKQIGIILPDLGAHQLAFDAINKTNIFVNTTNHDVVLFIEDIAKPVTRPMCSFMGVLEIADFNGILISTNFNTTLKMINTACPSKKLFYIWDLFWLRNNKNFLFNTSILRHKDIELVAKSEDHAKMVEKYCNRSVNCVIHDFDLNSFMEKFEQDIPKPSEKIFR